MMKILVCVKQVPDSESPIEIDDAHQWIRVDDRASYRMNRYDEYALEEAVLIREAFVDVTVDAISVGPPHTATTLKKSLEKGADNGIHVLIEGNGYCPPLLVAACIADFARQNGYDLIFTGVMAEDDMQCQTGPLIAARLGIPCAVSVMKESINTKNTAITVDCELEGGISETIILPIPSLLTIQSGINRPRYPSLSSVLRAKEQALIQLSPDPSFLPVATERLVSISYPEQLLKGTIIEGTPEEKAEKLLGILHEKSLL
ncbi:MAG: hypothetical protein A2176_15660 [Spirochaetes bacterium RBG_13_51_14]|nr:MAG: hypothetical protein A2176_15660 [Spirochaetes bacterium RBG_13_51_14]